MAKTSRPTVVPIGDSAVQLRRRTWSLRPREQVIDGSCTRLDSSTGLVVYSLTNSWNQNMKPPAALYGMVNRD